MKIVLLTVVLSIVQTPPPVPRQTPDSSAGTSKAVPQQANTKKPESPPAPPPAQQPTGAPDEQADKHKNAAEGEGQNDASNSVVIRELPPVTVAGPRRDWADWLNWVFTGLLAITSVLQVWLLCWTLRLIKHQAREATRQRVWMGRQWQQMVASGTQTDSLIKEAIKQTKELHDAASISLTHAEVALSNARTVINAERPWIIVSWKIEGDSVIVYGQIKGRTPARILRGWGDYVFVAHESDLPDEPQYTTTLDLPFDLLQVPEDGPFSTFLNPIDTWRLTPRWDKIMLMEEALYYFGRIVYTDMVCMDADGKPTTHETRWCFRYIPPGAVPMAGKPTYNRYT